MPETTRMRQGQIIKTVLAVLNENPEGLQVQEVIAATESRLDLSDYEKSFYPSHPGVKRFDKIVRFTTIGPVKAGWLIKSKGIWTITSEGRAALASFQDPSDLMSENVRLYREWKKSRPSVDADELDDIGDIEDGSTTTSFEEAEDSAWSEISRHLERMNPYDFQDLVAALLRAMGYHVPWTAPKGRDGGVDIVAFTDPIGATGPRIKVQVKRVTSAKIGVDGLRSFLAVLGSQDVGIFVSLGGFSSDAEFEASAQDNRRLILVDMRQLVTMWIEHYSKLREEDKTFLPLRPVHFLAPLE
jgi:restriction system protein